MQSNTEWYVFVGQASTTAASKGMRALYSSPAHFARCLLRGVNAGHLAQDVPPAIPKAGASRGVERPLNSCESGCLDDVARHHSCLLAKPFSQLTTPVNVSIT